MRPVVPNDIPVAEGDKAAAPFVADPATPTMHRARTSPVAPPTDGRSLDRALAGLLSIGWADPPSPPKSVKEWHALGAHAARSGMGGRLLVAADRQGWSVPDDVIRLCRSGALRVGARNRELLAELKRVLATLERAGVEVLLLKGAALNLVAAATQEGGVASRGLKPAAREEGDCSCELKSGDRGDTSEAVRRRLREAESKSRGGKEGESERRAGEDLSIDPVSLRPMGDIDLLVRPGDASKAIDALRAGRAQPGPAQSASLFPDYYYEAEWWSGLARIDLHVRSLRPMRVARFMPDDALWNDAALASLSPTRVWIPSNENMLLHLMAHAAFHGFDRLMWLDDIHRWAVERAGDIDWRLVVSRAAIWRLAHAVRRAAAVVESAFGATFPRTFHEWLAGAPRSTWRDRLALWHAPRDAGSPLGHVAVNLLTTPGLRHRAGYLARLLAPRREQLAALYHHRHPGWTACAAAWRVIRRLAPRLSGATEAPTP